MKRQLRSFVLAAAAVVAFGGAAAAQVHTMPVAPFDSIKSLPWVDTSIAAKWDSIGYPNGWNTFSVDVDVMKLISGDPAGLTFAVPPTWKQENGTSVCSTKDHLVHATILPLLMIPDGAKKIKLSLDFTSVNPDRILYVAALEGGTKRFDTEAFIQSMVTVFMGTPIKLQATDAPNPTKVSCEIDVTKYTSKEVNLVILAVDLDMPPIMTSNPGTYAIANVKLVDADAPSDVITESVQAPYVAQQNGSINVCNLAPDSEVEVFSLTGSKVLKTKATGSVMNVALHQGVYIVKVVNGTQLKTFKVVMSK